jgi:aspartyl protease family protein
MTSGGKQAFREGLLWAAAAIVTLAAIYFHHDISALLRGASVLDRLAGPEQGAEAPAVAALATGFDRKVRVDADARGHFMVEAAINDRPVTMMADTGATLVVLTFEDAERLGLSPRSLDFAGEAGTANGVARVAPLTLSRLRVADITLRDVPAIVAEPGALGVNLLGMSFLGRLKRFEMQRGELLLVQ